MRSLSAGLALGLLVAASSFAQSVISAHSGMVQYVEGRAFLDGQPVDLKFGHFPAIKENQEFRTEDGRAEILLTPGVFLRLGEDSGIRMLSNSLDNTRVEVTGGSAIVEVDEIPKDNAITLVYKNDSIALLKHGLYRVDAAHALVRVYDGEATVTSDSGKLTLKSSKETVLDGTLVAENFDKNAGDDELYRWADRRAGYISQANVSSASVLNGGSFGYGYGFGYGYDGFGPGFGPGLGLGYGYLDPGLAGGWLFNPLFGMYSWVPLAGMGYSPFGYGLFSPGTVANAPYFGRTYGRPSPATLRASGSTFRGGALGTGMSARNSGGGFAGAHGGGFAGARGGGGFSGGHAGGGGGGHGR